MNLSATKALLRRAAEEHEGRALVGFSGGKDSLVCLDLAQQTFQHVEAFCMALLVEMRSCVEPAQRAAERAGVKLHVVEHYNTHNFRRNAVLRWHSQKHWYNTIRKQVHVETDLREQTGISLVIYGHRQSDGIVRRAMLRQLTPMGYDRKGHRLYPLHDWKAAEVLAYLKARKLPIPERAGHGGIHGTSGLTIDQRGTAWLREHHPADYALLEREFPFIGIWAARAAFKEEHGQARQAPEVRDGAAQPQGHRRTSGESPED